MQGSRFAIRSGPGISFFETPGSGRVPDEFGSHKFSQIKAGRHHGRLPYDYGLIPLRLYKNIYSIHPLDIPKMAAGINAVQGRRYQARQEPVVTFQGKTGKHPWEW